MKLKYVAIIGLLVASAFYAGRAHAGEKLGELPKFPIVICQHRNAGTRMLKEIRDNAANVDVMMPMWFEVLDSGEIKSLSGCEGPYQVYVREAHELGIRVMPIVRNFAPRKLLSEQSHIDRMVREAAELTERESFDGLLVDLEELQRADREPLVELTRQLRASPKFGGKLLSVAVPKNPINDNVDYPGLGKECDFLFVMFYDYVGPWNKILGPTAPMRWPERKGDIEREFAHLIDVGVPRDRLLFGVPVYGNDFTLDQNGQVTQVRAVYLDTANEIQRKYGAELQFDAVKQSVYFNYTAEDGKSHQVWMEDQRSLKTKVDFAKQNQLRGIGVWAVVYPDQPVGGGFWSVVAEGREKLKR